jgi:poly-gamma-glutamate synthesis protein (capsule biosynthesis protein)
VDGAAFEALARIREALGGDRLAGHRERALERAYALERGDTLGFLGAQFVAGEDFGIESWPAPDDLVELMETIAQARRNADWVVVSLHSHEYDEDPAMPAAFAREACHRFIDAGAAAVLGHGEHGVRGVEIYRGRPIFHGLGTFVFQPYRHPSQPADFFEAHAMRSAPLAEVYATRRRTAGFLARRGTWQALLVRLDLAHAAAPSFTLHPLTLWRERWQDADGIPRLANGADGLEVLREVQRLSKDLGTTLALDEQAMTLRPACDADAALQPIEAGREAT